MSALNMSGLEFLQKMFAGEIDHPPIAHTIPMRGIEVEAGRVVYEAIADDRHINTLGGVDGGFIATVMDSITGCAVHSMLEAGIALATIDLQVKMLHPIPLNRALRAEAQVIHITNSLGVAAGTISDTSGKIYAYGNSTLLIRR